MAKPIARASLSQAVDLDDQEQVDAFSQKLNLRLAARHLADGLSPGSQVARREAPKVGRNDPLLWGSGRKFKKCCGP